MAIDEQYLKDVCKFGGGEATCAFLTMSGEGMQCAKGSSAEGYIRQRLFLELMTARGDNCEGWANRG